MLSNSQQPNIQFGSFNTHFSQSNEFSKDKIMTNTTFFVKEYPTSNWNTSH